MKLIEKIISRITAKDNKHPDLDKIESKQVKKDALNNARNYLIRVTEAINILSDLETALHSPNIEYNPENYVKATTEEMPILGKRKCLQFIFATGEKYPICARVIDVNIDINKEEK